MGFLPRQEFTSDGARPLGLPLLGRRGRLECGTRGSDVDVQARAGVDGGAEFLDLALREEALDLDALGACPPAVWRVALCLAARRLHLAHPRPLLGITHLFASSLTFMPPKHRKVKQNVSDFLGRWDRKKDPPRLSAELLDRGHTAA